MRLKVYLPIAVTAFLAGTMGADLFARTSIRGEPFAEALREHLYWASVQFIMTLLLLAPFIAVAWLCALTKKEARTRSANAIFAVAMLTLLYCYFQGYQGAQRALLEQKWTAATLSVGLLPFFVGVPVVFAVAIAGAFAAKFDRKRKGEPKPLMSAVRGKRRLFALVCRKD